ncbi:cytosolic fe-s cluster assembly factor [Anaeramoeba flamelloides]|uniref:Cytosolic fe-s cluster assembly factor n=1 Tax=Anaeramoeba flamelloides TaxID=1746091 RepID=A0ABQ8XFP1_9EUKA|nr:cytosolic fe-s cluster assembly factor [Anaeramoeba flamelloides]
MTRRSGLIVTDLDDFAPSQVCVNPLVQSKNKESTQITLTLEDLDDNSFNNGNGIGFEPESESESEEEEVQLTLSDCLACSGCITSIESILVNKQSLYKFIKVVSDQKQDNKVVIVSLSPQTRASVATYLNITPFEAQEKIANLFVKLGVHSVYDLSFGRDLYLQGLGEEFLSNCKKIEKIEKDYFEVKKKTQSKVQLNNLSLLLDDDDEYEDDDEEEELKIKIEQETQSEEKVSKNTFPTFVGNCPAWVCLAEKRYPELILPKMSKIMPEQEIMGYLLKKKVAALLSRKEEDIYHVSLMSCYDKKLEASREEFGTKTFGFKLVDSVLTSVEVKDLFQFDDIIAKFEKGEMEKEEMEKKFKKVDPKIDPETYQQILKKNMDNENPETVKQYSNLDYQNKKIYSMRERGSGGICEYLYRQMGQLFFNYQKDEIPKINWVNLRGKDFQSLKLKSKDQKKEIHFIRVYGFKNIQNLLRKMETDQETFHFIEIEACPHSACLNGGGQIKIDQIKKKRVQLNAILNAGQIVDKLEENYFNEKDFVIRLPDLNTEVNQIFEKYFSNENFKILKTEYHNRKKDFDKIKNPLELEW